MYRAFVSVLVVGLVARCGENFLFYLRYDVVRRRNMRRSQVSAPTTEIVF
jgi:hypothetical protein